MRTTKITGLVFIGLVFTQFLLSIKTFGQDWKQNSDSAKFYQNQNDIYKAIEFYSKAETELQIDSAGTNTYASICNNLANLYYKIKEYKKAEPLYKKVMSIWGKLFGDNDLKYAGICYNLANLYYRIKQYKEAQPLYFTALNIRKTRLKKTKKDSLDYALLCNSLGVLFKNMGQFQKADTLYKEAQWIRKQVKGTDSPEYASSCYNLANLYVELWQYENAKLLYSEAWEIRKKIPGVDSTDYAELCNNLAYLYETTGLLDSAEQLLLIVKRIDSQPGKDCSEYANSCDNLGDFYKDMGQVKRAEGQYIEAWEIRKEIPGVDSTDLERSFESLANLYLVMAQDTAQLNKAEGFYKRAIEIYHHMLTEKNIDDSLNYATDCNGLGQLYGAKGQYAKADTLLIEAMRIRANVLGKQHPVYAESCNNLGLLYENMGLYPKAELRYKEAQQIQEWAFGKQHPNYGLSCSNLGILYWAMQQPLRAESEFKESLSVNIHNLFYVFQFTNEKEKTAYIKNILGEDDVEYSFYASEKIKSEQPYSLSLFHRNLILSSSQSLRQQLLSSNDIILINKYNAWIKVKENLASLYCRPVDERNEDTAKMEEKADQMEKELTRLSPIFNKQQQRVSWKDIQSKLQNDEASIEFATFHFNNGRQETDSTYYIALVLRKDKPIPELIQLFEKKQLDILLNEAQKTYTGKNIAALYSGGTALYDLIWKPLEKCLCGINKVYFAPAGNLFIISFAALPIDNKKVLGDKYQLIQLNTTASVTDNEQSLISAGDKILIYGGINYDADSARLKKVALFYHLTNAKSRSLPNGFTGDAGFKYLWGTRKEAKKIKKLSDNAGVSATFFSGVDATEESVKALNGKTSPSVLHIATHGFFFPDPESDKTHTNGINVDIGGKVFRQSDNPLFRSGLALAGANYAWLGKPIAGIEDGILTAYEVSNMYLSNTKLVVLSACETALGDIKGSEGVYGLQRAFKIAGVQNLVMSLWKVPDAETAEFMQLFYKNLFAKQTISQAFYNTQLVMKNKYRDDPYKWAAWVLVR